jgi:hypothetical protein
VRARECAEFACARGAERTWKHRGDIWCSSRWLFIRTRVSNPFRASPHWWYALLKVSSPQSIDCACAPPFFFWCSFARGRIYSQEDTSAGILHLIELLVSQPEGGALPRLLGRKEHGSGHSALRSTHSDKRRSARLVVSTSSQSCRRLAAMLLSHPQYTGSDASLPMDEGADSAAPARPPALLSYLIEHLSLWYRQDAERCHLALRILVAVAASARHDELWNSFDGLFDAGVFHLMLDSSCGLAVKTAAIRLFGSLLRCEEVFVASVKTRSCPWCNLNDRLSDRNLMNESTVNEASALSVSASTISQAGHSSSKKARDQHKWPLLDRLSFLLTTKLNGSVEEVGCLLALGVSIPVVFCLFVLERVFFPGHRCVHVHLAFVCDRSPVSSPRCDHLPALTMCLRPWADHPLPSLP